MGEILLLLAQGQAVPVEAAFMALDVVGAVAQGQEDVVVVRGVCRVEPPSRWFTSRISNMSLIASIWRSTASSWANRHAAAGCGPGA